MVSQQNKQHITNLVFSGGGTKGLAYVGAIDALSAAEKLGDLKRVAGASAGAISASLLALNYSASEIYDEFKELGLSDFVEGRVLNFWAFLRLPFNWGLHDGSKFLEWIENHVEEKTGDRNTTFLELKEMRVRAEAEDIDYFKDRKKFGKFETAEAQMEAAKGFKDLYIVTHNFTDREQGVFSPELVHEHDTSIADAVRASMSFPIVFDPHMIKGRRHIDGGMQETYPIRVFDHPRYMADGGESVPPLGRFDAWINPETVGVRISTREEILQIKKPKRKSGEETIIDKVEGLSDQVQHNLLPRTIRGFISYLVGLANTISSWRSRAHLMQGDWERTIVVDADAVGLMDGTLSKEQRDALTQAGREGAKKFLKNWLQEGLEVDVTINPAREPERFAKEQERAKQIKMSNAQGEKSKSVVSFAEMIEHARQKSEKVDINLSR